MTCEVIILIFYFQLWADWNSGSNSLRAWRSEWEDCGRESCWGVIGLGAGVEGRSSVYVAWPYLNGVSSLSMDYLQGEGSRA